MNITINWWLVLYTVSMLIHVLCFDTWIVRLDKMSDDSQEVYFAAMMLTLSALWIIVLLWNIAEILC